MLTVGSDYRSAIRSINRSFTFSVVINGNTLSGSKFKSIKITETGVSTKKLCPGEYSKNSCELVATSDNGEQWEDRTYEVYLSVAGYADPIPMGKFWVNTIKDQDNGYAYKITGYSRDPWWDEQYNADNGLTAVSDILDYMETQSGATIHGKSMITLEEITAVPADVTNAQMLGMLAGFNGFCVRTTRDGEPELFRYTPLQYRVLVPQTTLYPSTTLYPGSVGEESSLVTYAADLRNIFESGLSIEKDTTIGSYAVTNTESTLTVGSGYGVEYSNPWVTEISQVYDLALYLNETYTPMTVKWRGDPALEIGDAIQVNGKLCYIMEQTFELDGGLRHTIKSYSGESSQMVLGSTTLDRKIRNIYSGMLKEIQKVFAGIFSAGNGYFSFINAEREPLDVDDIINGAVPAGFRISDEPEVTPTTKGWEFVLGGLYASDDGFRTPGKLALTQDGYIVGDRVLANSISTEQLTVAVRGIIDNVRMNFDFEDDGLHIARKDDDGNYAEGYQYKSIFNNMGFRVMDLTSEFASLVAEGDTVTANNLTADQYLRVRAVNVSARFQQFYSSVFQEPEFGIFQEVV